MAEERDAWFWCLRHGRVETGDDCPADQRLGPYPSADAAANWRDGVEARNKRWEDERWKR